MLEAVPAAAVTAIAVWAIMPTIKHWVLFRVAAPRNMMSSVVPFGLNVRALITAVEVFSEKRDESVACPDAAKNWPKALAKNIIVCPDVIVGSGVVALVTRLARQSWPGFTVHRSEAEKRALSTAKSPQDLKPWCM